MEIMITRIHRVQFGIREIVNALSICHFSMFILFYFYFLVILHSDIIRSFTVYASYKILFGRSHLEEYDRQGM